MARAILLAVGAVVVSLGGGREAVPTSPGAETQPKASGEKAIVIEWVGGTSEQVLMVEIRNRGTSPVDVGAYSLGDESRRCAADARLEAVRGSIFLAPGALALIATSPETNIDDPPRDKYPFVYRAIGSTGGPVHLLGRAVALFDGSGDMVDGGEVDEDDPIGLCCNPAMGESCFSLLVTNCDGANPQCSAQIRKSHCCKESALDACAFKESSSQTCSSNSCAGTGWTCCD